MLMNYTKLIYAKLQIFFGQSGKDIVDYISLACWQAPAGIFQFQFGPLTVYQKFIDEVAF